VIWLYAVCEQPERPLPGVSGLAGAPVEGIAEGPLLAVASRFERLPDEPAVDSLWAHERVVEAVQAQRAVLPVRFGTREPDEAGVRAGLASRREPLLAALERVRGRVELAVRATAPARRPRDGREYLRRRRGAAELHESLASLAVAARRRPEHGPGELLRASYLVEEPQLASFRANVERLGREHPEAALLCTGPWPAYSFVEAPE
jgi:Gas vesicle synthesis protein GvpL/GvpF